MKVLFIILLLSFWLSTASKAQESGRLALVIGNSDYRPDVGVLANPKNDAKLVAQALSADGFKVQTLIDARRVDMLRAINEFSIKLGALGKDSIGFIYYSGHGVSRPLYETNYLIPIDVSIDDDFWYNAVSLDQIMNELQLNAPESESFIVLDACRNNLRLPYKGTSKGFTNVSGKNGMLIAFSTSPDMMASDSGETAGPYARALAAELRVRQSHLQMFQEVRKRVYRFTHQQQRPWETNGMLDDLYLAGLPTKADQQQSKLDEGNESAVPIEKPIAKLAGTSESFCSDLKTLVAMSSQGFAGLRSGPPANGLWSSSFNITGFTGCTIVEPRPGNDGTYRCFTQQSKGKGRLLKIQSEFIHKAKECLGAEWTQNEIPSVGLMSIMHASPQQNILFGITDASAPMFSDNEKMFFAALQIYRQEDRETSSASDPDFEIPPVKPINYCADLKRAIEAASDSFSSAKGRQKFPNGFMSKISISGWQNCMIFTHENSYMSCELPEDRSLSVINKFIESMKSDISECIGEGWSLRARKDGDGREYQYFESATTKTEVELRSSRSGQGFKVNLDVNAN